MTVGKGSEEIVPTGSLLAAIFDAADVLAGVFELGEADYTYVYASRNTAFVDALVAHGVTPASFGGLFAWIPVRDAEATLASLAAGGVRLLGGDSSFAVAPKGDFVRLATTRLADDPFHLADLAAAIAAAAHGGVLVDTE